MVIQQSHLIEEDVYDAPYEETEGTTTRTPSRSTSNSIVDKLKYELSKRSKTEEVPSEGTIKRQFLMYNPKFYYNSWLNVA